MNLLLFSAEDIAANGQLRIADQRLKHLLEVHRAKEGDSIRVGEIDGLMGSGVIRHLSNTLAQIDYQLDQTPPAKLPLTLVLALPRPKMLRRILRTVAELGIAELYLINSARVEKSYWQSPVLTDKVITQYLLQGLEQARDTQLPPVRQHKRFKPFVEDKLPALVAGKLALAAHPGPYKPCPTNLECSTVLAIGPEGGWIPYEIDKLQEVGCQPISLGERILRVENAVCALTAKLFQNL